MRSRSGVDPAPQGWDRPSSMSEAPAAWHPDPDGRYAERYWNGGVWTLRVRDGGVEHLDSLRGGPVLEAQVQWYVRQGWRIESRAPTQVALLRGKRTNHVLHLLLSILTFGLWAIFVWLPIGLAGGVKRRVLTLDELGNVVTG